MDSAAGILGNPGMVIMSPVRATTKPAPARQPYALHRYAESMRTSQQGGIVRKGILGFGQADRQTPIAQLFQTVQFLRGSREIIRAFSAIYVLYNAVYFIL